MSQELKQAEEIAHRLAKEVSGIDLILVYGGLAQGRFNKYSDYDMIAISDKKKVVWEFVLEERPICLWPITWEKAERTIKGEINYWSVAAATFLEAKVVWAKSDKMIKKFEQLKDFAAEGGPRTLEKAIANFDNLYGIMWRMQKAIEKKNFLDFTLLKSGIANGLTHILAAFNDQYYLNNWGKQLPEIETFERIPAEFIENYKKFLQAEPEEALQIGETLIEEVKVLIRNWMNDQEQDKQNDIEELAKEWPGIIEWANKAYAATEKGDVIGGLMAAIENANTFMWAYLTLQSKKWSSNCFYSVDEEVLKLSKNVPKNIHTLLQSQNLVELKEATEGLISTLKEELELRRVTLPIAESLEDAMRFIQEKEL